jgi:chromosome segregation ATPase
MATSFSEPWSRKLKGVQPYESTDGFHRFRLTLNPGQSTELAIPEVISRQTQVELSELTREELVKFAGRDTPQAVRAKLGEIVDFQEQLDKMHADVEATNKAIDTLFRDQERLRENLKALRDTSEDQQLRSRYLDQLKKQEDRIDASRAHVDSITRDLDTVQAKLSDLISNLNFGN